MSTSFTALFSKIVDSSVWDEPDHVVKIFLTLLAKRDADHVVRGDEYNIARWSRKTEEEVEDALKILSSPDTRKKPRNGDDGRRIERVEDGWFIINGEKYQKMMMAIFRRAYKTQWDRDHRHNAGKNGGPTLEEQNYVKGEADPVPEIPLGKPVEQAIEDAKAEERDAKIGQQIGSGDPGF